MGRWRPPAEQRSPYITPEGHDTLQQELKGLWQRRNEVVKALAAAAAEGDRSENAEYIYRKKELRELDRRIRYLQKRLPELKVVTTLPSERHRIYFGAWIRVEEEDGSEALYRIVGPDEWDFDPRYISIDAPMAQALMGKALDDEVEVQRPGGPALCYVVAVSYGAPPEG